MKKTYSSGYFDFYYNIGLEKGHMEKTFKDPSTLIVTYKGTARKFLYPHFTMMVEVGLKVVPKRLLYLVDERPISYELELKKREKLSH
ncbi:hypothetical protein BS21228_22580 (plasmid) [Bacillus subtilis]|nr:hypothetical protein BS21228_22580 [Bacillus subtilis]